MSEETNNERIKQKDINAEYASRTPTHIDGSYIRFTHDQSFLGDDVLTIAYYKAVQLNSFISGKVVAAVVHKHKADADNRTIARFYAANKLAKWVSYPKDRSYDELSLKNAGIVILTVGDLLKSANSLISRVFNDNTAHEFVANLTINDFKHAHIASVLRQKYNV